MLEAGGGVYAMDWRKAGIRIWYFPPNEIPKDITSGKPTTSGWGTVIFEFREFPTDTVYSPWRIYRVNLAIFSTIFMIIILFLISRTNFRRLS